MKLGEDEWVCGMEELQENVALFSFAGGVVDDGFFESLEWKNSIRYDQILLISLSIFRIYVISCRSRGFSSLFISMMPYYYINFIL